MKLLIKFPTRVRARKFLNVLSKYVRLLEDKSTPIIVSCDSDDYSMKEEFVTEVIGQYKNVTMQFCKKTCFCTKSYSQISPSNPKK